MADPATAGADVYTKFHHYAMDYNKPQGQGWTYKGQLCDDYAYPGDPRLFSNLGGTRAWVRNLNSRKYLITDLGQQGGGISFFRFQTNSEVVLEALPWLVSRRKVA